jgi:uncharacterized protein YjiS (DUF1127 family)
MTAISARRRFRDRLSRLLRHSLLELLQDWSARARERRMLLQLDERMLKDIGVTRADVASEAAKPFWRE